jgi:8-oxo-dGTP diphosphatase
MKQIIRHGAYGIVIQDSRILLTQKKSGPYKGLWGLPGGAIEFGETPEETLKRELMEESCIKVSKLEFLTIATSTGNYQDNDIPYGFHQVGLLYKILDWEKEIQVFPEEENYWFELANIPHKELTPFALQAISILPQNQVWRPPNRIRGKVIGLAKHDNKLLVFEVLDDQGSLKGWCPIGGGIEFGEKAEEALIREINEELKCNVTITGKPIVCENIFEHHGSTGHEIIFAFPIKLSDQNIYSNTRFQIREERGSTHWVEWIPIERFEKSESILFPWILINKLKELS